ncbi:MAG: helix-turn-helix transcriptional regulator [Chloroflexia bacterium]
MKPDTREELALRRRLAILVMLHSAPHTLPQIQHALADKDLLDPESLDDPMLAGPSYHKVRRDLGTLRTLGYDIPCDRSTHLYTWHNSPFGVSLTPDQLFALGVLRDTFANTTMLHRTEIADLLDHLVNLLPAEQQAKLQKKRAYRIDLRETTDYRNADQPTVAKIELAIQRGQQLELIYRSPIEGKERTHTVEPHPLTYKGGHVYLPVYNINTGKEFDLRLDKILPGSVQILPRRAMPGRLARPTHPLRYRLAANIARDSVSDHFPGQQVERHLDGSATVTARTDDLFAARRLLLAYGEGVTVLDPPELVSEIRRTIEAMSHLYSSTMG